MKPAIDIDILRRDLMNYYGKAIFAGFDAALEDLIAVDKASEEELVRRAIKEGMNIEGYYVEH